MESFWSTEEEGRGTDKAEKGTTRSGNSFNGEGSFPPVGCLRSYAGGQQLLRRREATQGAAAAQARSCAGEGVAKQAREAATTTTITTTTTVATDTTITTPAAAAAAPPAPFTTTTSTTTTTTTTSLRNRTFTATQLFFLLKDLSEVFFLAVGLPVHLLCQLREESKAAARQVGHLFCNKAK